MPSVSGVDCLRQYPLALALARARTRLVGRKSSRSDSTSQMEMKYVTVHSAAQRESMFQGRSFSIDDRKSLVRAGKNRRQTPDGHAFGLSLFLGRLVGLVKDLP